MSSLSEEQKRRMEENRRKALERRAVSSTSKSSVDISTSTLNANAAPFVPFSGQAKLNFGQSSNSFRAKENISKQPTTKPPDKSKKLYK